MNEEDRKVMHEAIVRLRARAYEDAMLTALLELDETGQWASASKLIGEALDIVPGWSHSIKPHGVTGLGNSNAMLVGRLLQGLLARRLVTANRKAGTARLWWGLTDDGRYEARRLTVSGAEIEFSLRSK